VLLGQTLQTAAPVACSRTARARSGFVPLPQCACQSPVSIQHDLVGSALELFFVFEENSGISSTKRFKELKLRMGWHADILPKKSKKAKIKMQREKENVFSRKRC